MTLSAQNSQKSPMNEGKIVYSETMKMDIKLEGDAAQFADALPKEQTFYKELIFNSKAAVYKNNNEHNEEDAVTASSGNIRFKINMGGTNDLIYTEFGTGRKIEQKEFMTRNFIVESDIPDRGWKLSSEFSEILGYKCQAAISSDTTRKIKVWFSPEIPVSSGPAGLSGLPGMILMADIDNGKQVIKAISADSTSFDATALKKPADGKKVTQAEFDKIVSDKRKEMGEENGSGQTHIIIRTRN